MARYTDEEKAQAVTLLAAAGYPDVSGALISTSQALDIPERTLRRWAKGDIGAPPAKSVRIEKANLADRLEIIAGHTLDRIEERIGTAKAAKEVDLRDLVGLAKISIETRELLEGRATERHDLRAGLVIIDR